MDNSNWVFLSIVYDSQSFAIDGVDVWKKEWIQTDEKVDVKDPKYNQPFSVHVFEIHEGSKVVRFAAGEFSNCVWGFYVEKNKKPNSQ